MLYKCDTNDVDVSDFNILLGMQGSQAINMILVQLTRHSGNVLMSKLQSIPPKQKWDSAGLESIQNQGCQFRN